MTEETDTRFRAGIPSKELLTTLRFDSCMTREEIAEHFNTSVATVRRWIKELGVPRPTRQKPSKKNAHLSNIGEIIVDGGDGYSRFERARIVLEGRVIEFTGRGYYLDGRPARATDIIAAAGT